MRTGCDFTGNEFLQDESSTVFVVVSESSISMRAKLAVCSSSVFVAGGELSRSSIISSVGYFSCCLIEGETC